MTKRCFTILFAALLLAGCEDNANFWTAEVCNERLEADIVDFEEHQSMFKRANTEMETATRRGDTAAAEANKKSAESWKASTESLLTFIESNIKPHCDGKFRPDLLAKMEEARAFAKGATLKSAEAEGMPDLRVSSIQSTFVPYELDELGRCIGPFLNVVYTVTNGGAAYPRPIDLQTLTERAQRPAEEMHFFTLVGEWDFGGNMKKRLDLEVTGKNGGKIPSGGSLTIPAKIRIEHNQKQARATGYIATTAFLKNGNDGVKYETEVTVPIWDIYTFSHKALASKGEDGKPYFGAIGTVTNLSASPTPGPVEASFVVKDAETGRQITSWSGKTQGPVSGNTDLFVKEPFTGTLPPTLKVDTTIIPLCPDGTYGNLADGDTTNNVRTLVQQ